MIHTGDCIEVMAGMEPESVDAIVTDPPYGLEFMGKEWDRFDAGGKAWRRRKKETSDDPEKDWGVWNRTSARSPHQFVAGTPFQAWCTEWGREALRVTKPGGYLLAFGGTRTHHRLVCGLEDAGWIIRDELDWIYASGFPKGKANLKPAHEPIVLARKPGPLRALNIDESRIGTDTAAIRDRAPSTDLGMVNDDRWEPKPVSQRSYPDGATGRWPSNLLLSDPELFDEPNPWVVGSGATVKAGIAVGGNGNTASIYGTDLEKHAAEDQGYGDTGGYSRFFIIPKADRADREPLLRPDGHDPSKRFSTHPTIKPVDLMRHLIRLVTPQGGTVLDPFLGSGSTAIAAELEGFPWLGIEKEPEYVAIAEARLNGTQRGLGLDVGAPNRFKGRPDSKIPPTKWPRASSAEVFEGYTEPDEEPAA